MATTITLGDAIQGLLTALFSVGGLGYLLHAFFTDYKETKNELRTKQSKADCAALRADEKKDLERVNNDLQKHKGGNHD